MINPSKNLRSKQDLISLIVSWIIPVKNAFFKQVARNSCISIWQLNKKIVRSSLVIFVAIKRNWMTNWWHIYKNIIPRPYKDVLCTWQVCVWRLCSLVLTKKIKMIKKAPTLKEFKCSGREKIFTNKSDFMVQIMFQNVVVTKMADVRYSIVRYGMVLIPLMCRLSYQTIQTSPFS